MGYACPVCEVPQRDAEHLANHLAFTAMLHGDAHEDWLDEHAPGWSGGSPDELADRVAELATEAEYEVAFEDTVHGHDHDHDHDHGRDQVPDGHPDAPGGGRGSGRGPAVDPETAARRGGSAPADETRAVLREARELTRRMRTVEDEDAGSDGSAAEGGNEAAGTDAAADGPTDPDDGAGT